MVTFSPFVVTLVHVYRVFPLLLWSLWLTPLVLATQSVSKLKAIIETLSWNKMSVLHWHITEMDSFPLVLESVPQLAAKQSFTSQQGDPPSQSAVA